MIRILGTIFAGLLGLAFGSFLNVCLTRWPQGESVIHPRSHCRRCGRTLAWWENLPLLSWIALRGRCRTCRGWIGWRYPLVELVVGALWACAAWNSLPAALGVRITAILFAFVLIRAIAQMIFFWLLVALAVLDAENLWLPNKLTLPGIALGLLIAVTQPFVHFRLDTSTGLPITEGCEGARFGLWTPALYSLIAAIASAALILLIRWSYRLIRRREGIGLGDAKLMALLGAWLGLPGALLAFCLGVVMGAVVALVLLAIPSARASANAWALTKLPLGSFLCIGGIISALWGERIILAYLRWSGL
jgi:leader peptidase (prepilin peptidase)/N-methyltransferase